MIKSQNTKNEQHCIKQNEKSFIQKDLSLTELWQKGELPSGWYWVEGRRAEWIYAYTAEYLNNMYRPRNGEKIIEQVPSYDELQNMNKAINECMAANIKLVEQNTKIKELLKDARNVLKMVDTYYGDYDSTKGFLIVERIDEVLK